LSRHLPLPILRFWEKVTAYLLGSNLNVIPGKVVLNPVSTIGAQPLVAVDGGHTLLITLIYAIIFAASAIVLTWRRDVMEQAANTFRPPGKLAWRSSFRAGAPPM
jgi:hypothetical protein